MKTITHREHFNIDIQHLHFAIESIQYNVLDHHLNKTHAHGEHCFEIHYIKKGKGTLFIDYNEYALSEGILFMTGPHINHAMYPDTDAPLEELNIYFVLDIKNFNKHPLPQEWSNMITLLINNPFWIGTDRLKSHELMQKIFNAVHKRDRNYTITVSGLFIQLLASITNNYLHKSYTESKVEYKINDFSLTRTIDKAFSSFYGSSLTTLAQKLNLSPRQTERLIISIYGKTFREKRKEVRMITAANRLTASDATISTIAKDLNFSSAEHFSSAFKKYYGISPSAYRNNSKK